ncbi:hypothetical protein HPB48_015634 [Haemaphysalis longicornis]|uniref:Uncharacterized protein n=1 Tax=Haemaphysalis longicornis TaxID=44386 RepID=A0A9J6GDC5_HAELO|nr:hypothetical protein HPB48_015634 [Haemaphysalis longicornis]
MLKVKGNSKEIWNIITSVTKSSQKRRVLPDLGVLNCSEAALAEKFNDFFVNISSSITSNVDQNEDICLPSPLQNSFVFKEITREQIILVTKQMSSNKSVGHDEISVHILKANIDILSDPLQTTFNQSFMSGVFPDQLKVGRVVPIYKGDDPNDVENYRPITILPAVTILFDKLIALRMIEFIEKYQI